ncbi:hypothetical protein H0H81_009550, partial [Sphagnurus paluster]
AVLCTKYKNASEMQESADIYFAKFQAGLSRDSVAQWTRQIEQAESQRLHDITVMDIMQTRAVDTHSGDSTASHESIGVPASPDEEWVQLGIDQARRLQKEPREEDEKKIDNE